ncbi:MULTISPECIES: ABC transporter permease [unclassified Capnocytophaga]|jgi:ABC-type antimicrobial peptide transport system, permease component|uniref:ABC transporter permease n=1 Tax=unclassified Capnocytophaga TaxID=2640652 RepID=UPI000202CC2F|nr:MULTISPECIES: ABC transporter permease [unclassified Capnocytophaga]EGD33277.1 ABC superfamily ATP binding cassette transporter, membrane protein [Capnocytophaga sp. oral taxon 338 str. F0234]MEB3004129.1 ABC transporter permease [Capnocytophaga sp. G2]
MNLNNLFRIAWRAILLNKTRTLLTMLGIIIGVGSVITMLAIGEGSKKSIKESISKMGTNMLNIRPGAGRFGGVRMSMSEMQSLKMTDYLALKNEAKLLKYITPVVSGNGQSIAGANNWPTSIYGVNPEYLSIREWSVAEGAMFGQDEIDNLSKVAIIGKTIQKNLFPDGDSPIGQTIRFKNIPFKIIGILTPKGESNFGQDQDDIIIAPYTTVQKRVLAQTYLQSIVASVINESESENAVNEVKTILERTHNIAADQENDFNVFSQQELISTFSSTSEMLTVLLVAIASISLIVGGIGIMNIMYVSVKERTKEIGLRMAIGAKGKDILAQFLIESVLISITGGVVGVFIGLLATYIVNTFIGWPVSITFYSIVISFLVCTITGIFFGWYPARKAADLEPITALRYE